MYKNPYPEDSKDSILTVSSHWQWAEFIRKQTGKLPDRVHDFISVHKNTFDNNYSLLSPLCLVNEQTSARPSFERKRFRTENQAIRAAIRIASKHGLYVVLCLEDRAIAS